MIGRIIAPVLIAIIIGCGAYLYVAHRDAANVQKGVHQQVIRDVSQANQDIATRRATDATFDKNDAHAMCDFWKLEWVYDNDKSYCR